MLSNFLMDNSLVIFPGILLLLVLSGIISSRKKSRKEKPDPPAIFGPIRSMYVCYQCDTVFNTPYCPECNEEAVVPLIHLTGIVNDDERVAAVIDKLQNHRTWKLPAFQMLQGEQPVKPEPASVKKPPNGTATEVPVSISVLRSSERSPELS